ncbi:MAG: S9 family peptidase, partial [Proteobacteria bacterium]|nr:S9 family peptidase [Pseudomonadota bacterium]
MACGGPTTPDVNEPQDQSADQAHKTAEDHMIKYPAAHRGDVVDDYHGTKVADPYRWLEDPDSAESRAWIDEQNKITQTWLSVVQSRDKMRQRVEELFNYERYGVPSKKAGKYFYSHNDGLQNQSVLYVMDALDGEARLLLDPNT